MNGSLPDPTAFLDRVFADLARTGIDVRMFALDHVCYRVSTMDGYARMRNRWLERATLLSEASIGGRPISTFRLEHPIVHHERRIDVVELPAPKPGSPYPDGYEHVEFAVGEHPSLFAQRYPTLDWDRSDIDKPVNPDVRLRFDGSSVKFHEHSLAYVIAHLDPK